MLCARECPDWCIYIDSHKETLAGDDRGRSRAAAQRPRPVRHRLLALHVLRHLHRGLPVRRAALEPGVRVRRARHPRPAPREGAARPVDAHRAAAARPGPSLGRAGRDGRGDTAAPAAAGSCASARSAHRPGRRAAAARPPSRHRGRQRRPTPSARGGDVTALATSPSPPRRRRGGGALLAVTTRHVVHAALWLVVTPRGGRRCYLVLGAELVALVQVLVYVGAVVVLVLFALMLTRAPIGPDREHARALAAPRARRRCSAPASRPCCSAVAAAAGGRRRSSAATVDHHGRPAASCSAPGCGRSSCCPCCSSPRLVAALAVSRPRERGPGRDAGRASAPRGRAVIHLAGPYAARRRPRRHRRLRRARPPQRRARPHRRRADPQRLPTSCSSRPSAPRRRPLGRGQRRSPCSSSPSPPPRSASRSPSSCAVFRLQGHIDPSRRRATSPTTRRRSGDRPHHTTVQLLVLVPAVGALAVCCWPSRRAPRRAASSPCGPHWPVARRCSSTRRDGPPRGRRADLRRRSTSASCRSP